MATTQFLSIPSTSAGLTLTTGTVAWTYTAYSKIVRTQSALSIIGLDFATANIPALDTTTEVIFDIAIGETGSEVVKLQIPYSWRMDTAVGYYMLPAQKIFFPEPYSVSADVSISIRVANAGTTAITYNGIKLLAQPTTDLNTTRNIGQYAADEDTVIATGASTSDGVSTNVLLVAENDAFDPTALITPSAELEQVGTAFDNIATHTKTPFTPSQGSNIMFARRGGVMVYDAKNKRHIFFGGYDGTNRYNDVYALDTSTPGNAWKKLSPTGTPPTAKNLAAAAYVRGNKTTGGADTALMVIWGGALAASDTNEMHYLDVTTVGSEAWGTITQTSAPTARSYITGHMVSTPVSGDTSQNYLYLFGGWATARENQLVRCTIDVDAPGTCTWTTLLATGTAGNPAVRSGGVLAYKASTAKLYLLGGYDGTTYLNTFSSYDIAGNTWTTETVTGTPMTGRELFAGGYDVTNNRFWYTGGWSAGAITNTMNDVGYINSVGSSASWVQVKANEYSTNVGYAPNASPAFSVDADRKMLVMKGMQLKDSTDRYGYAIDFTNASTSEFPVYGWGYDNSELTPRDAPASVYDPNLGTLVIIGGFADLQDDTTITQGDHSNQVWSYNPTDNTWRMSNKGIKTIPYGEGRVAAYDTTRSRIIVFGGLTGTDYVSNDVWELKADALGNYKATKLRPTGTLPAARWLSALTYDAVNNRVLLSMGRDLTTFYNDVWSLSFAGSADGAWTQLTPTGTPPTGAAQPANFNKTSNTRWYIFGGSTNAAATIVSSQLLYFDYSTTNGAWTTIAATGGTARRGMAFGYDSTNDRLVIWGGHDGTNPLTAAQYLLLSGTTWATATIATKNPDARRSMGSAFIGGKLYSFGGRPNTTKWYNDTWELTPNYTTPNSSTWVEKQPDIFWPAYFNITGKTTSTSWHWQSWITQGNNSNLTVSFGGNAESVADFVIGNPAYTRTHTADANKKKSGTTVSHTVDTILRGTSFYTREQNNTLPTVATPRSIGFLTSEYTTVSANDSTYVDQAGAQYLLFYFERYHTNSTDTITATWDGKTTLPGSSRPIFLQIWNKTTALWETIQSNNTVAANTDFALTGSITTSLASYYDTGNKVVFRVYQ